MTTQVLNYLHRQGKQGLNTFLSRVGYRLKGFGNVDARYHSQFRAYSYKVNGIVYMSSGPGWAYEFEFLKTQLRDTYCHYYLPVENDVVVDIGAGLGEESVVFAILVGKKGKVYSIEANTVTFNALKYMRGQNCFEWMEVDNIAVYKENGIISIEDDTQNYLGNTIKESSSKEGSMQIEARTLDSFVREHNITQIDFLKSNIEGAEQYLIEGMNKAIKMVKHACISCHDFRHMDHGDGEFYLTKEKVKSFFRAHGFDIKSRVTGNSCVDDYIYATNPNIK